MAHDPIKELEKGIELLSDGLLLVDTYREQLAAMDGGPKQIDLTARLNAQSTVIDRVLKPVKEKLKAEALKQQVTLLRGILYDCEVTQGEKTVLDTKRVKQFLGAELHKFQGRKSETQIAFKVKS